MKNFKFCILVLMVTSALISRANSLPLSYTANILVRQFDPSNFPHSKVILKLDNLKVELEQIGSKPGLWAFTHVMEGNYYFEVKLFDMKSVLGKDYVKLDYQLGYVHTVQNGTAGMPLCGNSSNYAAMEDLKILEKFPSGNFCADQRLLGVGVELKKLPLN